MGDIFSKWFLKWGYILQAGTAMISQYTLQTGHLETDTKLLVTQTDMQSRNITQANDNKQEETSKTSHNQVAPIG